MKFGTNVVICIPTLKTSKRSPAWIDTLASFQLPLGSGVGRIWEEDKSIADARNDLCKRALSYNANYIFFIGDDVLAPHNTIMMMLDKISRKFNDIKADMITGVYWTKSYPTEPYLFNVGMTGPYKDWKAGDFFPVDMAGCDCLMIDVNVLKTVPYPWFSLDWKWDREDTRGSLTTEDFYFFTKARKHGFRLYADTSIQCIHEDRNTAGMYGITLDMPQAGGIRNLEEYAQKGELVAADLGAGLWSPTWPDNIKVVRFDARKDINIDVVCDISHIPDAYFNSFDIVHACHVLEHFPRKEALNLVKHWCRLLKPGGKFIIKVPNVKNAIDIINNAVDNPGKVDPEAQGYAWAQLYGDQQDNYETSFHKNGYIKEKLFSLLKAATWLTDVVITEPEKGQNLQAEAILVSTINDEVIGDWWEEIYKHENISPPALIIADATIAPVHAGGTKEIVEEAEKQLALEGIG